jgi:hypothetical protein
MVVLPIVNMLLTLLRFVTPWHKSPDANGKVAHDSTAGQAHIPQFNEVVQKG